jgi:hypothetical protein
MVKAKLAAELSDQHRQNLTVTMPHPIDS